MNPLILIIIISRKGEHAWMDLVTSERALVFLLLYPPKPIPSHTKYANQSNWSKGYLRLINPRLLWGINQLGSTPKGTIDSISPLPLMTDGSWCFYDILDGCHQHHQNDDEMNGKSWEKMKYQTFSSKSMEWTRVWNHRESCIICLIKSLQLLN